MAYQIPITYLTSARGHPYQAAVSPVHAVAQPASRQTAAMNVTPYGYPAAAAALAGLQGGFGYGNAAYVNAPGFYGPPHATAGSQQQQPVSGPSYQQQRGNLVPGGVGTPCFADPYQHKMKTDERIRAAAAAMDHPRLEPALVRKGAKLMAVWRPVHEAPAPAQASKSTVNRSGYTGTRRNTHPGVPSRSVTRGRVESGSRPPRPTSRRATHSGRRDVSCRRPSASGEGKAVDGLKNGEHGKGGDGCPLCQREKDIQARFDALYDDYKYRQLRRQRIAEQQEILDRENAQPRVLPDKSLSRTDFERRYRESLEMQAAKEIERRAQKEELDQMRAQQELEGCTFQPRLIAKSPAQKAEEVVEVRLRRLASKLNGTQRGHLEQMRRLDKEEQDVDQQIKEECEREMQRSLEANRQYVNRFLDSDEGKRVLEERTEAYIEFNPGIDEERARKEAEKDIRDYNDMQLRDKVLTFYKEKRHLQKQRRQIRRLQVLYELSRLEQQYRDIVGNRSVRKAHVVRDFDPNLVAKLKSQPWYALAKHSLAQIRAQAMAASTSSQHEPANDPSINDGRPRHTDGGDHETHVESGSPLSQLMAMGLSEEEARMALTHGE